MRKVPVAWEALEDAFENNAPEVHSYLHLETGEVIRIVDGVADPSMHSRIMGDSTYLRVDPVSSREQYRWMERFIATVDDAELRHQLFRAIDGKGAFRRFKDVLMTYPVDRERWFVFRSERVQSCMEAWLTAHGIEVVERPQWRVPSVDEIHVDGSHEASMDTITNTAALQSVDHSANAAMSNAAQNFLPIDVQRNRLLNMATKVPERCLDVALEFLEFLQQKHAPLPVATSQAPAALVPAAPVSCVPAPAGNGTSEVNQVTEMATGVVEAQKQ